MSQKDRPRNWHQMSDKELEHAARYYLWLTKAYPELGTLRLHEVIAEAERRGKPEILEQAEGSLERRQ